MIAIYKKEMKSYFTSMMVYIFFALFIAAIGIYFTYYCLAYGITDFAGYVLNSITILYLIIVPILTMRLMAEEKKQKTDQLLLTTPLRVSDIILGKYLAVITLLFIAMVIATGYGLFIGIFGKISIPNLMTGIVGYFLLGAALMAIGLFVSTISENQVTAAVISFGVVLAMFLLPNVASMAPGRARYTIAVSVIAAALIAYFFFEETKSVKTAAIVGAVLLAVIVAVWFLKPTLYDNGIANIISWFSVLERSSDFFSGILNVSSILYFISFIAVFLLLSVQSIQKRRWK